MGRRVQTAFAMDPLTAIAASGLRSRLESLDLLANNIANAATGGYKADREFYSLYLAPDARAADTSATMPVVERPWIDFSPGVFETTGNPLDLALSGNGFFAVDGPSGPLYTRNGSFHLSAKGNLVTEEGYPVRTAGGGSLALQNGNAIDIAADGTVTQDGNTIGQLQVVDFGDTSGLAKQGKSYFRATGSAAPAPSQALIQQGRREASNTGAAESAVRLVGILRQFEMLQKAVSMGADMSKQAIEQVAKVGS
jgi:flagellar basal body rod protein FlgG